MIMNKERFKIVHLRDISVCDIQDTEQEIPTFYNDLTYNFGAAKQICELLNKLSKENEQLRNLLNNIVSQIDKEYIVFPPIKNEYSVKVNVTVEEYDKIKEVVFSDK